MVSKTTNFFKNKWKNIQIEIIYNTMKYKADMWYNLHHSDFQYQQKHLYFEPRGTRGPDKLSYRTLQVYIESLRGRLKIDDILDHGFYIVYIWFIKYTEKLYQQIDSKYHWFLYYYNKWDWQWIDSHVGELICALRHVVSRKVLSFFNVFYNFFDKIIYKYFSYWHYLMC